MAEKKIYYIEDDVNEARRESKIIKIYCRQNN